MSTNEEIIVTNRELIEQYDPAFAHVLKVTTDALEQTTRELEAADKQIEIRERDSIATRLARVEGNAVDTLAKVREYLHGHRSVLDSHTKFELGSILDESASRPAPAEAGEHICGSNLPSGRVIPPSECAACASEKTGTGEREELAGQIVEGHRQATERGVTSLKERIAFMADTILAAGFRRAPIEDAEPFSCSLSGHAGCRRELREGSWWEVHLPAPTEDAEPVAYAVYGRKTGFLRYVQEDVDDTLREHYDVRPLYVHTAAPIEVTDEMVEAAAGAMRCSWSIPDDDHPTGSLCRMEGHCLDKARRALTAALKEVNR